MNAVVAVFCCSLVIVVWSFIMSLDDNQMPYILLLFFFHFFTSNTNFRLCWTTPVKYMNQFHNTKGVRHLTSPAPNFTGDVVCSLECEFSATPRRWFHVTRLIWKFFPHPPCAIFNAVSFLQKLLNLVQTVVSRSCVHLEINIHRSLFNCSRRLQLLWSVCMSVCSGCDT